jgi:hypothetical protein
MAKAIVRGRGSRMGWVSGSDSAVPCLPGGASMSGHGVLRGGRLVMAPGVNLSSGWPADPRPLLSSNAVAIMVLMVLEQVLRISRCTLLRVTRGDRRQVLRALGCDRMYSRRRAGATLLRGAVRQGRLGRSHAWGDFARPDC